MAFVHGRRLGAQLCEALGLDPNQITHISVHCSLNAEALVDVTYLVDADAESPVTRLFKSYKLEEVDR